MKRQYHALLQVADLFSVAKRDALQLQEQSASLLAVRDAISQIEALSPGIIVAMQRLHNAAAKGGAGGGDNKLLQLAGYGFALAVLLLVVLVFLVNQESKKRLAESLNQNEKTSALSCACWMK